MNNKPFSPEEFKDIYSRVPRLTVDLIVTMREGIVLTLRDLPYWNHQWHLPGGTVFYKETIEHAAMRVAREELGIAIRVKTPLGYIEYPSEELGNGALDGLSAWLFSVTLLNKILRSMMSPLKWGFLGNRQKIRFPNKRHFWSLIGGKQTLKALSDASAGTLFTAHPFPSQ